MGRKFKERKNEGEKNRYIDGKKERENYIYIKVRERGTQRKGESEGKIRRYREKEMGREGERKKVKDRKKLQMERMRENHRGK